MKLPVLKKTNDRKTAQSVLNGYAQDGLEMNGKAPEPGKKVMVVFIFG